LHSRSGSVAAHDGVPGAAGAKMVAVSGQPAGAAMLAMPGQLSWGRMSGIHCNDHSTTLSINNP